MAWGEKYKCEFADNLGLVWTVKIYEDGYSDTVTELTATGQPLIWSIIGNSDDIYDPILENEVKLRVWSSTNFSLADLYATEDMHFRMVITTPFGGSPVTRFDGYLDCGNYEEPYEDVPYEVTITAVSGLKFLKEIKFDDDGTPYNGRVLAHEIILNILDKIGFTKFAEYINLYEESMDSDVDDSPLNQLRIDVDLFRNMYCYDVLVEILKTFGAVMVQYGDYHYIFRPVELKNATVYGRYFQSPTSITGVSMTPQRYIDRSTNASNFVQVKGGVQMIIPPAKKVTIHQDYGNKESWIDNHRIPRSTWSILDSQFENWEPGAGWSRLNIEGESEGVVLEDTGGTTPPASTINVSQSFGTYIVTTSDILIFSFDYLTKNYTGGVVSAVTAYIMIKSDTASKYLEIDDEENYQWSDTEAMIELTLDVAVGKSDWTTFSRKIPGIPTSGSYTITLWGFDTVSAVFIMYKNLKFFATNDNITTQMVRKTFYPIPDADGLLKKIVNAIWRKKKWVEEKIYNDLPEIVQHDWEKTNAINGTELEYDVLLGDVTKSGTGGVNIDNIIEQFSGALICNERTLLQVVHTVTLTADTPDGTITITCDELAKDITYDTDLTTTAAAFVTAHNAAYALIGITVTSSGADIIFTGTAGEAFTGDTTVSDETGGLTGSVAETQPDSYSDALSYTTDWNSRGGSESKELGSILADEIAAQYARPKQLIQMALYDTNPLTITLWQLGCYEDDLNKYSGNNRKFVIGRGTFEVKQRFLMLDFKEVI